MDLADYIYDVPDFPEKGVIFRDITPLLSNPEAFSYCIELMIESVKWADCIVALDARGFIFWAVVAERLGLPFIPVRKSGKLPRETLSETYSLEYGKNTFEIHSDAIQSGQKVAFIDDVLATWGSMRAACNLVETLWGRVFCIVFLMELAFLSGADQLVWYDKKSLVVYN